MSPMMKSSYNLRIKSILFCSSGTPVRIVISFWNAIDTTGTDSEVYIKFPIKISNKELEGDQTVIRLNHSKRV